MFWLKKVIFFEVIGPFYHLNVWKWPTKKICWKLQVYVSCLFISTSFPSYLPIMVYSLYVVFSYIPHSLHIMLQEVLAPALNDNAVLSLVTGVSMLLPKKCQPWLLCGCYHTHLTLSPTLHFNQIPKWLSAQSSSEILYSWNEKTK